MSATVCNAQPIVSDAQTKAASSANLHTTLTASKTTVSLSAAPATSETARLRSGTARNAPTIAQSAPLLMTALSARAVTPFFKQMVSASNAKS